MPRKRKIPPQHGGWAKKWSSRKADLDFRGEFANNAWVNTWRQPYLMAVKRMPGDDTTGGKSFQAFDLPKLDVKLWPKLLDVNPHLKDDKGGWGVVPPRKFVEVSYRNLLYMALRAHASHVSGSFNPSSSDR